MPFTPSHAVIALPFLRTPLVPAAIAVGAMTPDLPLFVRAVVPAYDTTHDPAWLPLTVVLALVLLLVWRCLVRPAVRELSPRVVAARLPGEWDRGAVAAAAETFGMVRGRLKVTPVLLLLASLLIGVVSHIVWDAFTHEGRWGVALIPALDEQWGPLTGLKWLQHSSSALGMAILVVWGLLWLTRREPRPAPRMLPAAVRVGAWLSLPSILLVAWVLGLVTYGPLDADFTVAHLAYRVLPPACAVWAAVLLALAIAIQLRATRPGDSPL